VGRFPAAQRIRKRPEFQRIQGGGRRVVTPHFVLLVWARTAGPTPNSARLGITATRKVGPAVVRNRAKRLVREAFRATRDLWADDVDLVVIVRRVEATLSLGTAVEEWRRVQAAVRRRTQEARKDRDRRESELAQRPRSKQTRPDR
jgi:ribonuclease P protein component